MREEKISEPTIVGRLSETLSYLSVLERHFSDLESCVSGPSPNSGAKRDQAITIDQMAAEGCERAANLCGWMQTIKNRIGVPNSSDSSEAPVGWQTENRATKSTIAERR